MAAVVRAGPDIRGQIFVSVPDARIHDRHDHVAGRSPGTPRLGSVNVRVRLAALLSGIVQSPERAVQKRGIIWKNGVELDAIIGLGVLDQAAITVAEE